MLLILQFILSICYVSGLYAADSIVTEWGESGFILFAIVGGIIVCVVNGVRLL